ncbi:Endonuclease/Exonuclease/phosphatase family protein [uncultured archaeon]|nr:Endonuclease/Exonuclease/phosphatase family protein [uncultured archaeon]
MPYGGNTNLPDDSMAAEVQVNAKSIDSNGVFRIASWNLQAFGDSKASDSNLLNYYASKMRDYNIVVVQEIRDADGSAFKKLCALLPDYNCLASSRAGTTSSKEQYGIIFRGAGILEQHDYNEPGFRMKFERPPFAVKFRLGQHTFTVLILHAKPSDVERELENLQALADSLGGEVIVLGDLNADCDYYGEDSGAAFSNWLWAIPDSEDTTVSPNTDCTYDRIILNGEAKVGFVGYGVMNDVNSDASDHYLVWAGFRN